MSDFLRTRTLSVAQESRYNKSKNRRPFGENCIEINLVIHGGRSHLISNCTDKKKKIKRHRSNAENGTCEASSDVLKANQSTTGSDAQSPLPSQLSLKQPEPQFS